MKPTIKHRLLFFLISLFIFLAILLLILEILNFNKIALGLKVAGIEIGGLSTSEAEIILKNNFNTWQNKEMVLTYQNKTFSVKPEEMNISLHLDKTIALAYQRGRGKNIFTGLREQMLALLPLQQNNISPSFSFDEDKFRQVSEEKFAGIENPAVYASLVYNAKIKNWRVTPSKEGYIFDKEKLKEDLNKNIAGLSSLPIQLVLIKDFPEVLEGETENAKELANLILANAPYYLSAGGESPPGGKFTNGNQNKVKFWKIDRETLIDWLDFVPVDEPPPSSPHYPSSAEATAGKQGGEEMEERVNKILGVTLNKEKIKNILISIAPSINQEPVNAQLVLKDGRVTTFSLPQEGIRLDIDKTAEKIIQTITQRDRFEPGKVATNKDIELVVERKQPLIRSENFEELGLTSLLGQGVSNFAGSPKNRVHNIKIGAAKFSGILIKSGEEFSFNQILGEIGPKQGYLPELVIKKNKTIPEYGGGLCQVSTTAFRAAVNSGLKITERYPHAFPVKYYNPQGFDATIYPPHPDLRFINDTPKNILIQTKVEGNKLIFEFYGTDDGREIKVKGPYILSSNPDGSMKTILYQEIWRNGEAERQDKFFSSYKSPALYPVERNPLE